MRIKTVKTDGIPYLEPLTGSGEWYFGTDYTSGDLYEAEELFRNGHKISKNRLIFVRYPDGYVEEPLKAAEGQYFGRPVFDSGRIVILLADFNAGEIRLLAYDGGAVTPVVTIPLSEIEDCYNLMPHTSPLCLTRQTAERFQIIWPERADFEIAPQETFCFRDGDRLYFERWFEDPDYREETFVRSLTGELLERRKGSTMELPDGQIWILE